MKFLKQKKIVALLAIAVVAISAVGAYAYFTNSGQGTGTASVGSKVISADAERLEAAVCAKLSTVINFELPSTWPSTVPSERLVKLSTATGSVTPTPPAVGS